MVRPCALQNALEYAASHGLWEHALFLLQRHFANDAALQQRILMKYIEKQLAVEDPLRTCYELELSINPSICVSLNRYAVCSTYSIYTSKGHLYHPKRTALFEFSYSYFSRSNNIKAVKSTWKLHLAVMIVSLQQEGCGENRATCEIITRSLHEMALALGGAGYLFSAQFIYLLLSLLALHSARSSTEAPVEQQQQLQPPDPLAVLNRSLRLVLCERFQQELADEQLAVSFGGAHQRASPHSAAGGLARTPVASTSLSRQSATPLPASTPPTGAGVAAGSLSSQETFDIEFLYVFVLFTVVDSCFGYAHLPHFYIL